MPRLERRQALIEATIPLLLVQGAAVSTRQVAEAAGVAEGTIFRAFDSLEDLVHAATLEAIRRDDIADRLRAVGQTHSDLAGTLRELVRLLSDHVRRTRTFIELAHELHLRPDWRADFKLAADRRGSRPPTSSVRSAPAPGHDHHAPGPGRFHAAVTDAITEAIDRHRDELTTSPGQAASALVSLTFGALHPVAGHPELDDPSAITDLLLHGIAKDS